MSTNFLTKYDIASILKISTVQVRDLIIAEGIPFNQYHRRIIVKAENLNDYLVKGTSLVQHTPEPIKITESEG